MRSHLGVIALLIVGSTTMFVRAQSPADHEPAFEVASIKRSAADANGGGFRALPGRFVARNVPAAALIGVAYRDIVRDVQGAPDWAKSEHYDVDATVSTAGDSVDYPAMLRSLLRERFNFAGHIDTQQQDVLALVRDKADAPLPQSVKLVDVDCKQRAAAGQPAKPNPSSLTGDIPPCYSLDNGAIFNTGGTSMEQLASWLRPAVGEQVIDGTELPGYYAFQLHRARANVATPFPGEEDYPDVRTALREQLGLKLVPRKADVKVLVVDRVERPTPD